MTIRLREVDDGSHRASFAGLVSCGCVWTCVHCAQKVKHARAEELKAAVDAWKAEGGSVVLISATIRHGAGDDLARLRKGLANAWRGFASGRPWREVKEAAGLIGYARALEVTWGRAGAHPHLHGLFFVKDADELMALESKLKSMWERAVVRELGEGQRPDELHGLVATTATDGGYLAKMSLVDEMTSSSTKEGRAATSRSMWQVAKDFVRDGEAKDAAIWTAFAKGIRGARFLTWSRDLRRRLGLVGQERTDVEIANETLAAVSVATLGGSLWAALGRVYGARVAVLEAAETGGVDGVESAVEELVGGALVGQVRRVAGTLDDGESEPVTRRRAPSQPTSRRSVKRSTEVEVGDDPLRGWLDERDRDEREWLAKAGWLDERDRDEREWLAKLRAAAGWT